MTPEELRARREEIVAVAARHGAGNVRAFGSAVRGDAGPDSDIDLLVEFETGRSLLDQSALIGELEALLGRKVDVMSEGGSGSRSEWEITMRELPVDRQSCPIQDQRTTGAPRD
jgi:uncharacterized protein